MARSPGLAHLFQQPDLPAQRHYEICRAYFHESTPADEIAQRFDLHVGSVRAIVRDVARDPDLNAFFTTAKPGRKSSPKRDAIHQRACELRRQGASLADVRAALQREGFDISESYLFRVLRHAGLATPRQATPLKVVQQPRNVLMLKTLRDCCWRYESSTNQNLIYSLSRVRAVKTDSERIRASAT
jgi:transposase